MTESEEVRVVGYLSFGDEDGEDSLISLERDDDVIMIYSGKDGGGFFLSIPEPFFKTALKEIGFWMD